MLLTAKAMSLKIGNPIRKLVLLKLADQANDKGECWPSYKSISEAAECCRKSAIAHIKWLAQHGYLWVEERAIGNGQNLTNVYHLTLDKPSVTDAPPSVTDAPPSVTDALGGGVTVTPEPINNNQSMNQSINNITRTDGAEAVFADEADVGFDAAGEVEMMPKPPKGAVGKKNVKADMKSLLAEFGIVGQLADDYIAHRKSKRASISQTVLNNLAAEAAKAGMTVAQAVEYQIAQGWQGFCADWLLNKMGISAGHLKPETSNRVKNGVVLEQGEAKSGKAADVLRGLL